MDRNSARVMRSPHHIRSLSARRAWIEIHALSCPSCGQLVALRKESVDRNQSRNFYRHFIAVALRKESVDRNDASMADGVSIASLSARRAWIEMEDDGILSTGAPVALRKESVDRNIGCRKRYFKCSGRSPQGERG